MSVQFLSQLDLVPPYEVAFWEYSLFMHRSFVVKSKVLNLNRDLKEKCTSSLNYTCA